MYSNNNMTKKKFPPSLPLDCIVEILEYHRNDKKTLFSNLFVNRTWCQLIIPLLWCRPFEIRNKEKIMIIDTLILCLSKQEKLKFLDKMNGNRKMINIERTPIFDYPHYIRGLDYRNLECLIESWVTNSNDNLLPRNIEIFLFNLIGNLIFTRSRGLTSLTLEHYDYYYYKFRKSNYTSLKNILSFNNIKNALENLQKLEIKFFSEIYDEKISSDIISNLFFTLSKYSNNIKHIYIDVSAEEISQICNSFTNLIESQTNLITLEVNQYLGFSFVNSLYTQSNSLTFLKINYLKNFHSLLPALSACINLETLEFSEYFMIEDIDDLVNSVNNLSPIHIKNLLAYRIDPESIEENFAASMMILIKLSVNTLKSLTLDHVNQGILEVISINCPRINYLSLNIIPEEISFFSKILSSLTCLESLIFIEDFTGEILYRTRDVLLDIAINLPPSLKYFGFWTMDYNILNDFLQNIHVPSLQELDIFKGLNDLELNIIINFARKNGNLKKFGYKKVFSSESNVSENCFNEAKSIIPIIGEARHIKHYVIN
ncbi:hypothetical protein RclHR1_03880008 [Rhizophagus clarus]|uniref:F-box domain-containing protein n=1 Tax=Rhizophagus clarus TaxID=94130 RepID=A0A2Z6RD81_9GLOM|nr:hypothetical protein RclHR1_03880008 [Rhizophagus clarus]GET01694.1 hypothetical protein GLOIN_2v1837073 [Rhizophagus clarus]